MIGMATLDPRVKSRTRRGDVIINALSFRERESTVHESEEQPGYLPVPRT
jgi:hypothetical protein